MAEEKTRVVSSSNGDVRPPDGPGTGPADGHSQATIPLGTLLIHTYRIERLLGTGGMGEVYLARHMELDTRHAVKVIRPALFENRQVLDLFRREATVLRGVRHDAVVSYDGFFRDEHGRNYLVMEYVEGPSLRERLRQGPLSPEETLVLRNRLAEGLAEAHRKGAVHRDISPDNIILPNGRLVDAKLIDFGLCKLTDPTQQTIIGSAFGGKFRFASPEQLGLFEGKVDARSDVYSLGLVLAAAAGGRPLDMGNSFDGVVQARRSVPDLSRVPDTLREQIAAMLEPDPAYRPQSMAELLERWPASAIEETTRIDERRVTQASTGIRERGESEHPTARRWARLVGGVIVIALLAAGGYWAVCQMVPDLCRERILTPPSMEELVKLPWEEVSPYFREWVEQGKTDEAFALLKQTAEQGKALPAEDTYAFARDLIQRGRLDDAFALIRQLANGGHAASSLALGEMYDPVVWTAETSPLKPKAKKAKLWYRRALDQGAEGARSRLDELEQWERSQGADSDDAR